MHNLCMLHMYDQGFQTRKVSR